MKTFFYFSNTRFVDPFRLPLYANRFCETSRFIVIILGHSLMSRKGGFCGAREKKINVVHPFSRVLLIFNLISFTSYAATSFIGSIFLQPRFFEVLAFNYRWCYMFMKLWTHFSLIYPLFDCLLYLRTKKNIYIYTLKNLMPILLTSVIVCISKSTNLY